MDEKRLLAELHAAKKQVTEAEEELRKLLGRLELAARAEKTTVSETVKAAFDKLGAARQHLGTVEGLASHSDEDGANTKSKKHK